MSAPRLILKQPTGWFAAGREFTQAITILSDGAFKLYVYACLRAGRHTGCLRATVDELARAMTRAPTVIAMNLDELEALAVCRVIRNGGSQLVLEISDRFWPYQKQQTPLSDVNYSFPSCCLIQKCYRRIARASSWNLSRSVLENQSTAGRFCRILVVVGEAEAGSGGDQPAKE
jgi:hypothetical protein